MTTATINTRAAARYSDNKVRIEDELVAAMDFAASVAKARTDWDRRNLRTEAADMVKSIQELLNVLRPKKL